LRTDFRKSRLSAALVFLLAIAPLFADVSQNSATQYLSDTLLVNVRVSGISTDEFLTNLYDGLTAEIEYHIRVSAAREAPFSILGDRLLLDVTPSASVFYDRFTRQFILSTPFGTVAEVTSEEELLDSFFALVDYRIPVDRLKDSGPLPEELTVQTQVAYRPILFVPTLRILSLFLRDDRRSSPWVRDDVRIAF
jgi:hypothetical protein